MGEWAKLLVAALVGAVATIAVGYVGAKVRNYTFTSLRSP
jgi:uncharacterized membrane protein YeaQ/YmgE (transglycosylase-associated protein family)